MAAVQNTSGKSDEKLAASAGSRVNTAKAFHGRTFQVNSFKYDVLSHMMELLLRIMYIYINIMYISLDVY